ncbi:MAG: L,D-transpeptidase family protein [Lachnospiraceae bacterium]|nr:L,D-transpeptidase family protein [Lachnospiraceae bacterium]MDD3615911.1 L,D-transpeptidase family protein [Lachnospiraceae bacterium]
MKKRANKLLALVLAAAMMIPSNVFAAAEAPAVGGELPASVESTAGESTNADNTEIKIPEVENTLDSSVTTSNETAPVSIDDQVVETQDEQMPEALALNVSPKNSSAVNDAVELRGVADHVSDKEGVVYRYIYFDGITWRDIKTSDVLETVNWTPAQAGSYILCFQIVYEGKNYNSMTAYTVQNRSLKITGLDNKLSTDGKNVTITPKLETNVNASGLKYSYQIYDLESLVWTNLEMDTTASSCVWTPKKSGGYWIHVTVKDDFGLNQTYTMCYGVSEPSISGFDTDVKSPHVVDQPIVLTGSVKNPSEQELTYEYLVYYNGYWKSLSKKTTLDSYSWKPDKKGSYLLCFQIYRGDKVVEQKFIYYTIAAPVITGDKVIYDDSEESSIKLDTDITSNDVNGEYRWLVYHLDNKVWELVQDWSKTKTASWDPPKAGGYWLHVEYRTKDGQTKQATVGYSVKDIEVTSFTVDKPSPVGVTTTITLSGKVRNPLKEKLTYRYIYYDGITWHEISSSDKLEPCEWTPEIGNYLLCLQVIDSNKKAYNSFLSYVVEPLRTEITGMTLYTPDDKTYFARVDTDSNDPKLTYEYQRYDVEKGIWYSLPMGDNHTTYWIANKSGGQWFHAIVTDSEGKTYTKTLGVNVQSYKIKDFTTEDRILKPGVQTTLKMEGTKNFDEKVTYCLSQWQNDGSWKRLMTSDTKKSYSWTPTIKGYYAFVYQVYNEDGYLVDQKVLNISPNNFEKNGWYYEDGYKFYYINGVKQTNLDGILPKQSDYIAKVNRITCTVTVYASDGANGFIIPVKVFACSVGLRATPTPTGTFHTIEKYRWAYLMGPSWGQYGTRIVGGIYFHSVAGSAPNSYAISAGNYNMLGQPASHGCIRLCVRDAKWLYDNCKKGMEVTIYDSSYPGPLGKGSHILIPAGQNWDPTDPAIAR